MAKAKKLTPLSVQNVKPRRNARTEIPDSGNPGLFLIVQPSGVKSWALRYRSAKGQSRKLTLGAAAGPEALTLAAAHLAASQAKLEISKGADPAAVKAEARAASKKLTSLQASDGIVDAIEQFMTLHARPKTRPATWKAYDSIFKRLVVPAWRDRTVHEIKRRDVIALVEGIAVKTPYMANRLLGALSKFFNWAVARDLIDTSPATGVERPHTEIARDRVLDDTEVTTLWKACTDLGPAADYVRLLLLLGCRRSELGASRFDEIDAENRTLTIPASRSKNRRAHVIPLVDAAWDIIAAQKRTGSPYLFPAKWGSGPLVAFHHLKDRIDERAKLAKPWRLHDTRRTCASGMQRLGVPVEVIEATLGHSSGVFRGIVGTYQRHDYADERRIALGKWADHIAQLTGGKPAKVVQLHGKRR
jgi:integrase